VPLNKNKMFIYFMMEWMEYDVSPATPNRKKKQGMIGARLDKDEGKKKRHA
jgi:hypothetical protein